MFPDVNNDFGHVFWGEMLPDPGPSPTDVEPTEPAGAATFVLDLEDGLNVTLEWQTDVFKAYDGKEQRRAILDSPRRRFRGTALLAGDAVLTTRAQLAKFATTGQPFALGLPYEALLLTGDANAKTVTVEAGQLAQCDWANPGQRVVILGRDRSTRDAVIQNASGSTIALSLAVGSTGKEGGYIMPTVAVYLDPLQSFDRYRTPDGLERWTIDALALSFGFAKQAVAASLDIEQTLTGKDNLIGLVLQARAPGLAGNSIRIRFEDDALLGVEVEESGNDVTVRFIPSVTTVGELAAEITAQSTLVRSIGTWNEAFIVSDGEDDTFAYTNLTGGTDGELVVDGIGATVAMHAGKPVFDRPLLNAETIQDSMQAMNELVDLGGVAANVGKATSADWGRAANLDQPLDVEWQWVKRFLATVRGSAKAFWMATWRQDLFAVATGTGTLTVQLGSFFSWYPTRKDLQVWQADGTITYLTISGAVDNGDGTVELAVGVTLSASAIEMISWLELCRFNDAAVTVHFENARAQLQTVPRAVQQ